MITDLPESILTRAQRLAELHRAHPTTEMGEAAHLMTEMLHIAVRGDTWARPESAQEVWLGLLAEVRERRPGARPARMPLVINTWPGSGPPSPR